MNAATVTSTSRFPRAGVISAFARRDFLVTRSYRLPFVLETLFGVLELAVYFFISKSVGGTGLGSLHGAPTYFAFAAVGIIIGAVLNATSTSIAARVREEQLTGTLEVLAAQPVGAVELCAGLVSFPLAFASVRAMFWLAVAGFWMDLDVSKTSWFGVATMLAAAALALMPLGILAGALVLLYKRGAVLGSTLLFAMTLVGGALFPISVLPGWLEWVGRAMPVRFAFDGLRAALFSGSGWSRDALALLAFGAALAPIATGVFALAVGRAKTVGSISEY